MVQARVRWVFLLAAALPALIPLYIIFAWGLNFPYLDQWDVNIAGLFVRFHNGTWSVADFFAQHNEHRIFVPRLIFFVLATLTHWNIYFEMLTTWLFACGTSIGLLVLILRTFGLSLKQIDGRPIFLWFACNFVMFTPSEFENWMWGMGLQNLLPPFWLVWGLVVATSRKLGPWPATIVVTLLCIAATGSSGSGVFCWPLVGVVLFWSDSWAELKSKLWRLAAFCGTFVFFALLLYATYRPPPITPGEAVEFPGIYAALRFLVANQGSNFSRAATIDPPHMGILTGSIELLLLLLAGCYFAYAWFANRNRELTTAALIWLAIAGFSLLSGIAATRLRSAQGIQLAFASRYLAYSTLLPIGLINLIPLLCQQLRRIAAGASSMKVPLDWVGAHFPIVAGTSVILLQFASLPNGFQGCAMQRGDQAAWRSAVLLINSMPPGNPLQNSDPARYDELVAKARGVNAMGYLHPPLVPDANMTPFLDQTALPPNSPMKGGIDNFAEYEPGRVGASGWAIDFANKHGADSVFLTYRNLLGQEIFLALAVANGAPRDDVAAREGNEGFRMCSWVTHFSVDQIPATPNKRTLVTVWAFDTDTGRAYQLPDQRVLTR